MIENPEPLPGPPEPQPQRPLPPEPYPRAGAGIWTAGARISWVAGLVLMLSSFTDWYAGSGEGLTIGVIGWHTGALGKLVFFLGLVVVLLAILGEVGIELPPAIPESLVVIAIGALATIFVLIRLISIPDKFLPADGRGIGIWIALLSAIAVIFAGLLRAGEEL
ncbi:MAG TPA: hypothetical protein VF895_08335 [Gaiellaceae bacterium]